MAIADIERLAHRPVGAAVRRYQKGAESDRGDFNAVVEIDVFHYCPHALSCNLNSFPHGAQRSFADDYKSDKYREPLCRR